MVTEIWVSRRQGSEMLPDHTDKNRDENKGDWFNSYQNELNGSALNMFTMIRYKWSISSWSLYFRRKQLYDTACEVC